ncbi:hypothetical protein GCM10009863_33670 [Streptomyces axinellae]|uniref:Uncharacterized protein n=1 Tax=Streptomyces axinellae TaxID=552788 RepID=A0ABN3Q8I3_9ACTN
MLTELAVHRVELLLNAGSLAAEQSGGTERHAVLVHGAGAMPPLPGDEGLSSPESAQEPLSGNAEMRMSSDRRPRGPTAAVQASGRTPAAPSAPMDIPRPRGGVLAVSDRTARSFAVLPAGGGGETPARTGATYS